MKKLLTFLFATLLFVTKSNAQVFKTTIGNNDNLEYGVSISQAADSSYLLAGYYIENATGSTYPYVTHLKKNGSLDWVKQISIAPSFYKTYTRAEAVKTADSKPNGYIVLVDATSDDNTYLVRLNNDGSVAWSKKFNTSSSNGKVRPIYNNTGTLLGFYILAEYGQTIIRTGTTGNITWQKKVTHNVQGDLYRFEDIQVTTDGGCIAVGNIYTDGGGHYSLPVAFRFTSTGAVLFGHTYSLIPNNESNPLFYGVCLTNTGFAITAGATGWGNITFTINSIGQVIWSNRFSVDDALGVTLEGSQIVRDAAGNLIIACGASTPYRNGVIMKLNASGVLQFAKKYFDVGAFKDIKVTREGSYCAVGRGSLSGEADMAVLNVSNLGSIAATCRPTNITVTFAATPYKLVGTPAFSVVNAAVVVVTVTVRTGVLQTSQVICNTPAIEDNTVIEKETDQLQVANDITGQHVVIKWLTKLTDHAMYEATLFNNFGQPVINITLTANQPAYIPMNKMKTGIYSVMLKQDSKLIAKEKVVWVK